MADQGDDGSYQRVVTNRQARHKYDVEETYEAGLVLKGSEVKSLREGKVNITEGYCDVRDGEMWIYNMHIPPYEKGGKHFNHRSRRDRKLLLHKHEIQKLGRAIEREGYTAIPLEVYFRDGYAKLKIGLAKGKKKHDRRQSIKEEEAERRMRRQMRDHTR